MKNIILIKFHSKVFQTVIHIILPAVKRMGFEKGGKWLDYLAILDCSKFFKTMSHYVSLIICLSSKRSGFFGSSFTFRIVDFMKLVLDGDKFVFIFPLTSKFPSAM